MQDGEREVLSFIEKSLRGLLGDDGIGSIRISTALGDTPPRHRFSHSETRT